MEIEALEAIFGGDFKKASENGLISAVLSLGPSETAGMGAGDDGNGEEEQKSNEEYVRIRLISTFPKTYPEVVPIVSYPLFIDIDVDRVFNILYIYDDDANKEMMKL